MCIGSTYTWDIYYNCSCIETITCSRDTWMINIRAINAKNTWFKDGYFFKNTCVKDTGMDDICYLVYKLSKSFIKYLKMLVELISEIFVCSFCTCK